MQQPDPAAADAGRRCAFCGYPLVDGGVTDGPASSGAYCSETCRDAAAEGEQPFVGRHDYKRVRAGVPALDQVLPQGIRTDSLVLLRADTGTNRRELQLEMTWRALQRGEPAVVISYLDPPTAVVERFLALGWNVLPALERGQLTVVDSFTHRLSDSEEFSASMNRWNEHLARALEGSVTTVRNPDDLREVENRLISVVEDLEMVNTGIVDLDSLEEVGALASDPQVENFLKEVRADVCQNRFVPLIVGQCSDRSVGNARQQSPAAGGGLTTDVTYFADGIVDVRLNPDVVEDTRLKQLSVRRMRGVRAVPQWMTFELVDGSHLVFDPATQTRAMYATELFVDGEVDTGRAPRRDGREQDGQSAGPSETRRDSVA